MVKAVRRMVLVIAAGLSLTACSGEGESSGSTVETMPITGTLTMNGCVLPPESLRLHAFPMVAGSEPLSPEAPGSAPSITATLTATKDAPHRLKYTFQQALPGQIYKLRVELAPDACGGKVFWTAPYGGWVAAGAQDTELSGHAARTSLEVLREGEGEEQWVGADALDFTDPSAALRRIRWRSTIEGVTGGQLQISTEPFPTPTSGGATDSCAEPAEGIILRRPVPVRGPGWTEPDAIDFTSLLGPDQRPRFKPGAYELIQRGAPLYARIVPETAEGLACDPARYGIHGWVLLSKLIERAPVQLPPGGIVRPDPRLIAPVWSRYTPPSRPYMLHPDPLLREYGFRAVVDHKLPSEDCWQSLKAGQFPGPNHPLLSDPLGCYLITAKWFNPGVTVPAGYWFYFRELQEHTSWFEDVVEAFTDVITGLVDVIGEAVNYAAKVVETVKKAVATVIVKVISAIPILAQACDGLGQITGSSCEGLVTQGLNIGLVAMGLPPSLPNWEELKEQGIQYLAAQIASQMSPLPASMTQDVLEQTAHSALDEMGRQRASITEASFGWALLDSGMELGSLTLRLKKSQPAPLADTQQLWVYSEGLFPNVVVGVPKVFPPSGELTIPISLPISYEGLVRPHCRRALGKPWQCQPDASLKVSKCEVQLSPSQWQALPCGRLVHLYFREQWFDKLRATRCFKLGAISFLGGQGSPAPAFPDPPYHTDATLLLGSLAASWDGESHVDYGCR